jgi:hypothetical protein
MAQSRLIKLLNNDPKFFYYNGNPNNKKNGGGLGNFTQKSIQPGGDRPGDSSSGQPYIVTPIPLRSGNAADDGYIRGGRFLASSAAEIDARRIKKFFADKPRGPLFIARQIGLQLSNPKIETRKFGTGQGTLLGSLLNIGAATLNAINNRLPGPTRIYNSGINTLAQIPATAFGTHYERHGLLPVQDENTKYYNVVKTNNENGNNRLLGLTNRLINVPILDKKPQGGFDIGNLTNNTLSIIGAIRGRPIAPLFVGGRFAPQDLTIEQYNGGPNSIYGVGTTLIRRYDVTYDSTGNAGNTYSTLERGDVDFDRIQTLSDLYNNAPNPAPTDAISRSLLGLNNFNRRSFSSLESSPQNQTAVSYNDNIPAGANPYGSSNSPTARSYADLKAAVEQLKVRDTTIETTATEGFRTDPDTGRAIGLDSRVNKLSNWAYYGRRRLASQDPTVALYNNTNEFDRIDSNILRVVFQAMNPFGSFEKGETFAFSAYIKGFKDNFDANWNEYNYVGRSESFYTYGKFKRSVSFNLDIPCFNKIQLLEKHRALGQLASTTAGSYNDKGIMGGVVLKVQVGKYLYDEYAILNNISYDIPDDSSWDIDEGLAMYLKVSISLTIIHSKKLPQYEVGSSNSNTGFFGYLQNPLGEGYLDPEYKLQYSNGGGSRANLNINRFNNAINQQFIPGLNPGNNPNAQTALQRSLNQGANQYATQVNPLTNQLLSNQRTSPAAITNFQKYNQQKTNELLLKSKWKRG